MPATAMASVAPWVWHSASSDLVREVLEGEREWFPVHGGTTILTRALVLLAMLGFRKVEVFGWDSCLRGDAHHAYSQPENDSERVIEMEVGGKVFRCHGWMVIQAQDFQSVVKNILGLIRDVRLCVHGDGLIAHLLDYSATQAALEER